MALVSSPYRHSVVNSVSSPFDFLVTLFDKTIETVHQILHYISFNSISKLEIKISFYVYIFLLQSFELT